MTRGTVPVVHAVNSLAAVLNAHADNRLLEKNFWKYNFGYFISWKTHCQQPWISITAADEDGSVSGKRVCRLSEQSLTARSICRTLKITNWMPFHYDLKRKRNGGYDGDIELILHTGPDRSRKKSFCPALMAGDFSAIVTAVQSNRQYCKMLWSYRKRR